MFFLLLLSFIFSTPTDQNIVICYLKCPEDASGIQIIVPSKEFDLSEEVDKYLSGVLSSIYFYNETDFVFSIDLSVFEGHTVEFLRYDQSKFVSIELECTNKNGISSGSFRFNNVDIDLSSSIHLDYVKFEGFKAIQTSISLFQIDPNLKACSVEGDNSLQIFESIHIQKGFSETGMTLNVDSSLSFSVQAVDNGATIGLKKGALSVTYEDSLPAKRLQIVNSDYSTTSCELSYNCQTFSKFIHITLTDINNLYFVGTWNENAIVDVDHEVFSTICANSTILPVSLKNSMSQIIITQDSTTITGDVSSSVVLVDPSVTFRHRKNIVFKGNFTGKLDCGSSYFEITINNLGLDISSRGELPFTARVGTGGASTLNVLHSISKTTKMTTITVYPDFSSYLQDSDLQLLLDNKWNILTLSEAEFTIQIANVAMQEMPFVHGFVAGDSCISVEIQKNTMVLTATPPSILPLNICYDGDKQGGDCDDDDGIEIDDINKVSEYFLPGMKYLNLTVKIFRINYIDLTSFDYGYSDTKIIIRGGSNTIIGKIETKEGLGVEYLEVNNIVFSMSATYYLNTIGLFNCKVDGNPTFTFKQCKSITGDDSFLQYISPHISPSSPVEKITYRVDKYDAMTITDDKFIFYDIAMNDLEAPAEMDRDIVGFLDLIYDVGVTETAEDNDLNITMQTAKPPSFNVTFSQLFSTGVWGEPELQLYGWSMSQSSDFKVYFMHDILNVKIILTEPYRPDQVIPVGSGIVTYEDRYSDNGNYCTAPAESKDSCPANTIYATFDEINNVLSSSTYNNITVYVKSTSASYPTIDLHSIDKKVTYFSGFSDAKGTDYVQIKSSADVDLKLTTMHFDNIVIKPESNADLTFGELHLVDATLDAGFANVNIKVDDLFCHYETLPMLKSITITDNCVVNGPLATKESTVTFIPDKDANDLKANISTDANIVMGDKSIKIGQTTFQFGSMESVYDINLFIESQKKININKAAGVSETNIPNVAVMKSSGASFYFADEWKGDKRNKPHVFLFYDIESISVYIKGQNTPVSFSGDGALNLMADGANVGITGFIEFHDMSKTSSISVIKSVDKSVLTIGDHVEIAKRVNIFLNQNNLEFVLNDVNGPPRETAIIKPELFADLDGVSLLTIKGQMSNVIISSDYSVEVPIKEDLGSNKVKEFYRTNHTLIKINQNYIGSCDVRSFSLVGIQPTTHGFYETNMNVQVDELKGEIYLYMKVDPYDVPFSFCYEYSETTGTCEFTLTESTLDKVDTYVPTSPHVLHFWFGKENTNSLMLNSKKLDGATVYLMQHSEAQLGVTVNVGNGIINKIVLDRVSARIVEDKFQVNYLDITNYAEVDKINGFDIICIDYDTVWKLQVFPKCDNLLILNLTANLLEFTNTGWLINGKDAISDDDYPNLNFRMDDKVTTTFEASPDLTTLKSTTIYTTANKFILGSNWGSITRADSEVDFEFGGDKNISVFANSYPFLPFRQLMAANNIQINESVFPINVKSDVVFEGINSVIDMSNVADITKAKINFEAVTMSGLSGLSVKGVTSPNYDAYNPINIQTLSITDNSEVSLNYALVEKQLDISGNSKITGDFDFSVDTNVNIKWSLNKIPQIFITQLPPNAPFSINFTFDGTSISRLEKEYEAFLYGTDIELIRINRLTRCNLWLEKLKFVSPYVSLFGADSVFDSSCNDRSLMLHGARHIVNKSKKGLSGGAIAGIVITVIVLVAAIAFGVYYYITKVRNTSYKQLDSDYLQSKDLNQQVPYTN